jgi:predicted nucleic acid-binding protein
VFLKALKAENVILISDTGPLIALAKIEKINLLRVSGWDAVMIPPAVHRELRAKTGPESDIIESAIKDFIRAATPGQRDVYIETETAGLGDGEKDVIRLGMSLQEQPFLLMDDRAGRRAALRLGMRVIGTAGVLLAAKQDGFIEKVLPLLNELREKGYWLSDALIFHARRLSGE